MTITQKLVHVESSPPQLRTAQAKAPGIAVLIPAYNEEKGIEHVIKKTRAVMERISDKYSILVVDDDSKDKTRDILESVGSEVQRFYHRKNMGKGDVIRNALQFLAPGEVVVTMDGDGEHDPEELPRLLQPVLENRADIVIGSRFLNARQYSSYLSRNKEGKFVKNLGNRLFTILLWIFTRKTIHDTQSGYRVFKAQKVKALRLSSDGFRIEMEMTVKALRRGFKISEVSITNKQGKRASHVNIVKDGAKIGMTVLRECLPPAIKRPMDWFLPRLPERLGSLLR